MSVTPNFSWPLIEPTDFVTNLPADLEALADDIDADVWAIKGTADAALPETIIDAAGDLIYGSAADTAARLPIGTAGQVLTVNSGATAPQWANPAGAGAYNLLSTTTLSGTTTAITGISGSYKHLYIEIEDAARAGTFEFRVRPDSSASGNFYTSTKSNSTASNSNTNTVIRVDDGLVDGTYNNFFAGHIYNYAASKWKPFIFSAIYFDNSLGAALGRSFLGGRADTSAIDSLEIVASQSLSGGTVRIYGVN